MFCTCTVALWSRRRICMRLRSLVNEKQLYKTVILCNLRCSYIFYFVTRNFLTGFVRMTKHDKRYFFTLDAGSRPPGIQKLKIVEPEPTKRSFAKLSNKKNCHLVGFISSCSRCYCSTIKSFRFLTTTKIKYVKIAEKTV